MTNKKLKSIVSRRITDGPHVSPDYVDDGVAFISGGEIVNGRIVFKENTKKISEELHQIFYKRTPTKKNDILLVKNGSIGNCAFVDTTERFSIWVPLALIKLQRFYNSKFIFYNIISEQIQSYLKENAADAAQPNISINTINNIVISIPPLATQTAIANFLDHHTGKIDTKVDLLEKKIALLDEYQEALIYEAVTNGLNKSALMKNSGVDWIGCIPTNWEIKRLKDISKINKGKAFDESLADLDGDYPYINGGVSPSGWSKGYNADENTIAVSEGGASSGYAQFMSTKYWAGGHCYKVSKKKGSQTKYIYYLLKGYSKIIMSSKTGSAMPNLQQNKFINTVVPFTKAEKEQLEIVNFLDIETRSIENEIHLLHRKIDLLKEYKQSLICEAVAGKLDLCN